MTGTQISKIVGRQILDSRGRPTVEVDITLADGSFGRACAPSGASTGRHEAAELRDKDPAAFEGLGVLKAVSHVNGQIARQITGLNAIDQSGVDSALVSLDESPRYENIGANALLATSLALSRAAAVSQAMPLHLYLNALLGDRPASMPMPMTNILSGGAHAGRAMDFQDFLVVPVGADSYGQAIGYIARVRASAAAVMSEQGLSTLLADEGGLSPGLPTSVEALDLMMRAFDHAGLRPGEDVAIALDVAASELTDGDAYFLRGADQRCSGEEMVDLIADLVARYPIVSVEDPLDQDDWPHWKTATEKLADIQLLGDDLFVTNADRIREGIDRGVGNAVLIKVNQNGTLSGTLNAMRTAWSAGYATIVSARSGETEDSYIADLAVGSGAGQIKIGSLRSSERLAKYNQLIRIDDGTIAFAGKQALAGGGKSRGPSHQASLGGLHAIV